MNISDSLSDGGEESNTAVYDAAAAVHKSAPAVAKFYNIRGKGIV